MVLPDIHTCIGVCPEPFMENLQMLSLSVTFLLSAFIVISMHKALDNAAMLSILRIRLKGCAKENSGVGCACSAA